MPWEERELLLEGLRAEFGQQPWNEAVEDVMAQLEHPGFAAAAAAPPQEDRDDSLGSLAELGITVREAH